MSQHSDHGQSSCPSGFDRDHDDVPCLPLFKDYFNDFVSKATFRHFFVSDVSLAIGAIRTSQRPFTLPAAAAFVVAHDPSSRSDAMPGLHGEDPPLIRISPCP